MGQPITVVERDSHRPGVLRFGSTNRSPVWGHERYPVAAYDNVRPPNSPAGCSPQRASQIHIYGSVITVDLAKGATRRRLIDRASSSLLVRRPVQAPLADLGHRPDAVSVLHTPLQIGGTTTVRNRLYRAPVLEGAGDGDAADVYAQFVAKRTPAMASG